MFLSPLSSYVVSNNKTSDLMRWKTIAVIALIMGVAMMMCLSLGLAWGQEESSPSQNDALQPAQEIFQPDLSQQLKGGVFSPIIVDRLPFLLGLPLECDGSQGCFILNYFDRDPSPLARDQWCGGQTYDDHQGVDFALRNLAHMDENVAVIAAVDGVVQATRDYMPDVHTDAIGEDILNPVGLGNAVVLSHDFDMQTIYGHLKKGSVRVKKGQIVKRGDVLGFIGLSGISDFPHVHFEVKIKQSSIDPYGFDVSDPQTPIPCGQDADNAFTLEANAAYPQSPARIVSDGWSDIPLNHAAILYGMGNQKTMKNTLQNLFYNVQAQGLRQGDRYQMIITNPKGEEIYAIDTQWQKNSAFALIRGGLKNIKKPLYVGEYHAVFNLWRTLEDVERRLAHTKQTLTITLTQ